MTSFFWSTLLLVATGATARKEFFYDVSFLKSTLLLVPTGVIGATGRNKSGCVIFICVVNFKSSLPLLVTGLNHVKICLSSWFHIMPKLLLRSYFQHIVIWYCQKRDLDFYFSQ